MQRHPALQDLSRDHFEALNQVVRVRRVIEADPHAAPWTNVRSRFLVFARGALAAHFEQEEQILLPVLDGRSTTSQLAPRLLADHDALRTGIAGLGSDAEPAATWPVAQALEAHIRWEERVVFQALQDACTGDELAALAEASRRFRRPRGLPVGADRPRD